MTDHAQWLFTAQKLTFEVPFTRQAVEFSSTFATVATWGTALAYIICILFIFPLLKPKTDGEIKTFAKWHHGALCIYSTFVFLCAFYYMYTAGNFTNYDAFLCGHIPDWLRLVSLGFTISKIWEWLDTAILIWNNKSFKQIGFLHLYHHCTTTYLFWHVMNFPGTEKCGMLMNGFVHSIMYYHFAWRLPMMFRPLITFAQILQLSSATYFHYIIPHKCAEFANFPVEHAIEHIIPYIFVPVYCLFFIKFFFEQYCMSAKPKTIKNTKAE